MVKPSSIEVIDYEIDKLKSDIPRYCLTANKAAFKKGERDIHADRIVEWAEHRLANLEAAKADISALAERCERLEAQVLNLQGECNAAFEAGWDVCWERWSDKHHRSTVSVSDMNTDMDAYMQRRRGELSERNGGKSG